MNIPFALQYEAVELTDTVTRNYEQLVNARGDSSDVLEKTFEDRMNKALEQYYDLVKAAGRTSIPSAWAA